MGDIVRPDFRRGMSARPKAPASAYGVPQKIYGHVGHFCVELYHDGGGERYPLYKLMLERLDTREIHCLAILPASQAALFEAHAIAAAVLQALRLTANVNSEA
jgi:hypothetical protein